MVRIITSCYPPYFDDLYSLEDNKLKYGFQTAHSLPRNPRVQGKVERWNRVLGNWMATLMEANLSPEYDTYESQ